MPGFTESNITLNFPDSNFFRFEDCSGHNRLDNIKEMDVCWYQQTTDTLYIIELKDWNNNILLEESDPSYSIENTEEMKKDISSYRIRELWKKSLDSVCMFMCIALGKPYSTQIQSCSPFTIKPTTQIILLSIINWTDPDNTYIFNINTQYKSKFNSYAKLFNIKVFLVLTKVQAKEKFNWIQ